MTHSFFIVTYGCQMNEHDSENIAGRLAAAGFTPADSPENADVVLVNTCVVRKSAEERAFGQLTHLKRLKKNRETIIGCCGCLASLRGQDLLKIIPHIDFVLTTQDIDDVAVIVREAFNTRQAGQFEERAFIPDNRASLRKNTFRAWISIMKGCDNFCSYCIVPFTRGREISRPAKEILSEAASLVNDGVREIVLLGQNVNSYGLKPGGEICFAELLAAVAAIPGDFQVRYMTSQPLDFTPSIAEAVAASSKISRHFHLPMQSGSDRILSLMNRRYTVEGYEAIVSQIRDTVPGASVTTDIITGFPGETESDFSETIATVERIRFNGLFVFIYSDRSGTAAQKLPDKVPDQVKKARLQQLLSLQESITAEKHAELAGSITRVLAERMTGRAPGQIFGHDTHNRVVLFQGSKEQLGRFAQVRIKSAGHWALKGELVEA
ncbi:MAG: tRNA (N6-isopentenyl adenosine(37)-C2)-methylthiotransferase MiaB [Candidatus Wallbacteria bacterium]|nr:tRNA (N6-isopentenyl adenosine(37)-C2)-methylthiotransferase MiaB [Candidatus Wallbacteria bacterium]